MKLYKPMLAQSAESPFSANDWVFEVKWDGIRAIAYIGSDFSLKSRNQREIKDNFPELSELEKLAVEVVLDGEIIVLRDGLVDFQTLIERNQATSKKSIEFMSKKFPSTYVVFDILEKDGKPLIDLPLEKRKSILKSSIRDGDYVVLSQYVEGKGEEYFEAVQKKGMEGVVAKKKASRYLPGKRSGEWLKIKKIKSCDCVIFGYTGGKSEEIGALVLGLYDGGNPVYIGKVGTGFSKETLALLKKLFRELKTENAILEGVDKLELINWLDPKLVVEVGYQEVTKEGKLRLPRFKQLRTEKDPKSCDISQLISKKLDKYEAKRDFKKTPEPRGGGDKNPEKTFVVHEHNARRLHYDLRLEKGGVLKSWAVPKGIPLTSGEKRLAVETEDHPLEYGTFEGTIPKGEYGAGTVKIWDSGLYEPLYWDDDKIEVLFKGDKLEGMYVLVKFKRVGKKDWLVFKAQG
jgi:DNA ligase D-like protein (predicted ligase)/DNA ligase D-like protein (predicted 3'-phosphoesterase)